MHTTVPATAGQRPPLEQPSPDHLTATARHRRAARTRTGTRTRRDLAVGTAAAVGRIVTSLALLVLAFAAVAGTAIGGPESAPTVVSGGSR